MKRIVPLLMILLAAGCAVPAAGSEEGTVYSSAMEQEDHTGMKLVSGIMYDKKGKVLNEIHYTYDSEGRVIETTVNDRRDEYMYVEKNEYLSDGSMKIRRYDEDGELSGEEFRDAHGTVVKRTEYSRGKVFYESVDSPEYDEEGRLIRSVSDTGDMTEYTYDEHGKVVSEVTSSEGGPVKVIRYTYRYQDEVMVFMEEKIEDAGTITEEYDTFGKLLKTTEQSKDDKMITLMDYDAGGNLIRSRVYDQEETEENLQMYVIYSYE